MCIRDSYLLESSGCLDALAPKAVVVESVGRALAGRYGKRVLRPDDPLYRMTGEQFKKLAARGRTAVQAQADGPFQPRMVKANWEYLKALQQRRAHADRFSELTRSARLGQPLFSNPGTERLLLYYADDLHSFPNAAAMETIDRNFAAAQARLEDRGMRLVVLPCVDKFDLYWPCIAARETPENPLFELWRELDTPYRWVDTKRILRTQLARGVRDLYWQDDTHWSWKACLPVAEEIARQSGLLR